MRQHSVISHDSRPNLSLHFTSVGHSAKKERNREAVPGSARKSTASNVSAETPRSIPTTLLEQTLSRERRRLLQVHSVLHCLYDVLLYAEGEDAITYAEAAHLAAMMVDESAAQLDSLSIKPLIDALKMESGGHGGGGFSVREPPSPPYLLS
jgi:hypothetical protein